jgi:hypothetical protein
MTTDIFIRTCAKDLEWLLLSVKSIKERVTGYRNIVIAAPRPVAARISRATGMPVIGVDPFNDDYVGQMHTKLKATDHTDADVICFWDSDTMAAEAVDLNELLFDGERLIMHQVPYAGLTDGSQVWQPIAAHAMGFVPEFESMRRMPLAYHRSTILGTVAQIELTQGMTLDAYVRRRPFRSFIEFNCLGAWAYLNERDRYDWRIDETEVAKWKQRVRQFWSWGGITREVKDELKNINIG